MSICEGKYLFMYHFDLSKKKETHIIQLHFSFGNSHTQCRAFSSLCFSKINLLSNKKQKTKKKTKKKKKAFIFPPILNDIALALHGFPTLVLFSNDVPIDSRGILWEQRISCKPTSVGCEIWPISIMFPKLLGFLVVFSYVLIVSFVFLSPPLSSRGEMSASLHEIAVWKWRIDDCHLRYKCILISFPWRRRRRRNKITVVLLFSQSAVLSLACS